MNRHFAIAAASLALKQRAGGIVVPIITVLIAFLMSGIVVAATQHSIHKALLAYHDIFNGSGLNWIFHPTTNILDPSAYNLSQTLLQSTTLILTGLAVAFAFRCGMFNIGGQGQYFVGIYAANWIGVDFAGMSPLPHILLAISAATLAGAAWAGIAGVLKATVGAHEVISTIMLNWIAVWGGEYLFGDGGPLQNSANSALPISNDVAEGAKQRLQPAQLVRQIGVAARVRDKIVQPAVEHAMKQRCPVGFRLCGVVPDERAHCVLDHVERIVAAAAGKFGHAQGTPLDAAQKQVEGALIRAGRIHALDRFQLKV